MRERKRAILVIFMLVLTTVVFANGSQEASRMEASFGDVFPVDDPYTLADEYFVDTVADLTENMLVINYHPGSELGSEREMVEAVKLGSLEITQASAGTLASYYPKFSMLEIPYLSRNYDEYQKIQNSEWLKKTGEEFRQKTGMRILGYRDRAPRQLTTKFPVNTVDDIKGIKIRVAESPIRVALWKALDTNPTPIAFSELYIALSTGIVDAQENPLDTILSAKLYEQNKYIALTGHMREFVAIIVNDKWFSALPQEYQEVLEKAVGMHVKYANSLIAGAQENATSMLLGNGATVTEPDLTGFIEKTSNVYKEFIGGDFSEDDWNELQTELGH